MTNYVIKFKSNADYVGLIQAIGEQKKDDGKIRVLNHGNWSNGYVVFYKLSNRRVAEYIAWVNGGDIGWVYKYIQTLNDSESIDSLFTYCDTISEYRNLYRQETIENIIKHDDN